MRPGRASRAVPVTTTGTLAPAVHRSARGPSCASLPRSRPARRESFRQRSLTAVLCTVVVLIGEVGVHAQEAVPTATEPGSRIRQIHVHSHRLFDRDDQWFYRVVNAIHVPTREHVVRRELLYRTHEPLEMARIEETERNLRALDFIAAAWTEIVEVSPGWVDVHVHTRDRLGLRVELNADISGGESEYRFGLGDRNLFGFGKSVRGAVIKKDDGERIRRASYRDPRLFGSRYDLSAEVSHNSKKGTRTSGALTLPFYSLRTQWSHGVRARVEDGEATFFAGSSETTVDQEVDELSLFVSRGFGPAESRKFVTLQVDHSARRYESVAGPRAAEITVPGDTESRIVTLGLTLDRNHGFQERTFVDALGATEDVRIGWTVSGRAGPVFRNEEGVGHRVNTLIGLAGSWVADPTPGHLLAARLQGDGRFGSGDVRGWAISAFYHHYWELEPERHTLAFNAAFDGVYEGEGLTAELYLGEGSGLRGFDTREFFGQKRIRLNLEHRWSFAGEWWRFRAGLVPFLDAGYVWPRGDSISLGDVRTSIGIGLRVGSVPILGKRVARIDVAFPLGDDRSGKRPGVSVLFTFGQVFNLLSNSEGLSRDF